MSDRPALESKVAAFVDALKAMALPPLESLSAAEARYLVARLRPPAPDIPLPEVRDMAAPGPAGPIPLRLYGPSGTPRAVVLYIHGGGWVLGGIEESDVFARTLASRTGCIVVSVGYRLAPEAPYPAAITDCMAALDWVATHIAGGLPLAVMGDSAGGTLSTVVAAQARDKGSPTISAQILAYPVTDAAMNTRSYRDFADDALLPASLMRWFWNHYAPYAARQAPDLSPVHAELRGLPPTFILTAEHDVLRDEGEAYGRKLVEAGVPTRIKRYPGQIHSFLTFVGLSDGGEEALGDIVSYLQTTLMGKGNCS